MKPTSFPPLKNDQFLRAARGLPVQRVPIWLMRQAGRYLPEFRRLRQAYDFFTVCRTPELAAEVTLQPLERFDLDAAIIFSDILVVPQALGMEVQMRKGHGPHFPDPLRSPEDVARLKAGDVHEELSYVYEALTLTRHRLQGKVPLIGFSGAPWTLMVYMVEGGPSKTYARPRAWLYSHPEASHKLLNRLTEVIIPYLKRQIQAGAQALQLFDSWAGLLGPEAFQTFAWPYLQRIAREIKRDYPEVPLILFARGAHHALPLYRTSDYDVIGLDWTMDPRQSRQAIGPHKSLQGNLDPAVLYASPARIREEVQRMLEAFGPHRYIANLGHGMYPDHDPEHVRVLVDTMHQASETLLQTSSTTASS